jgi:hypothetical protein
VLVGLEAISAKRWRRRGVDEADSDGVDASLSDRPQPYSTSVLFYATLVAVVVWDIIGPIELPEQRKPCVLYCLGNQAKPLNHQ